MMKKIFIAMMFFISTESFSCNNALPTDDPNFCSSFKSVATCYCTSSGLPSGMCQNMNTLYARMISIFGSLQKACEYQTSTTPQDCVNNWNCYLNGGVDSFGKSCSSTRMPCQ